MTDTSLGEVASPARAAKWLGSFNPVYRLRRGAGSRTAPDLYAGFQGHYTQTVTRKKVAGIEVAFLRGLVF